MRAIRSGPSADGFETYGVTGVALISFILLAVNNDLVKVELLVWIFMMRVMMVIASGLSYFINDAVAKARYQNVDKMNYGDAFDHFGVVNVHYFYCCDLRGFLPDDPRYRRRSQFMVEAFDNHYLRDFGGRSDSGVGEGVYVCGFGARQRSGYVIQGRRGRR